MDENDRTLTGSASVEKTEPETETAKENTSEERTGTKTDGAAYGTSNGLFGQTNRDSGEYHFRSGYTRQVYSNANYIPEKDSTVPPRYYRPASSARDSGEKNAEPKERKRSAKKSGAGFILVLILCFFSAVIGGALSCLLIVRHVNHPENSFLSTVVGGSTMDLLLYPSEENASSEADDSTESETGTETGTGTEDPLIKASLTMEAAVPEETELMTPAEVYNLSCNQVVSLATDIINVDIYGNQTPSTISGTGFLISDDGYILTNYHVIQYAAESGIAVGVTTYDGSVYVGNVVGMDEDRDLAIVKIEKDGFLPVVFGDSELVSVGDPIYAVGNPYGILEFTMTMGHISALNRMIATDEAEDNATKMFQIDAAVFSGNSGGPVYNSRGEVVGIVSARYSQEGLEGIGFAIPINDAVPIVAELLDKGYVSGKATLNASFDERYNTVYSRYYRLPEGAYVYSVGNGGAADKAGIRPGDIIMQIGDYKISAYSDVPSALRHYKAGDSAKVLLYRDGSILSASVSFDEYIPEPTSNSVSAYATKYRNDRNGRY